MLHIFKQILKGAPNKTVAARPLTSHLTNHSSKMNQTYWALPDKQRWTLKQQSLMDSYTWTCQRWLTYISSVWTQNTKHRKCVSISEKRQTHWCSIKQLGLWTTDRDIHQMTRNRTVLILWAPVKCLSTMCYGRIKVSCFCHACLCSFGPYKSHDAPSLGGNFLFISLGE